MQVSYVDRSGLMTASMKEFAERRLYFALSRFGSKIASVSVVVQDVNGPRGGVDKSCRIVARMRKAPEVTAASEHDDLQTAVATSADRLGHAISRALDKRRTIRRRNAISL